MMATLDGYVWLPRMIDKALANNSGTIGSYYRYPCPIDKVCLDRLGIDAKSFSNIVQSAKNEDEVLAGLKKHGVADPHKANFDPIKLNQELHSRGS